MQFKEEMKFNGSMVFFNSKSDTCSVKQSIDASQIPQKVRDTILCLQKMLPEANFYLTGGGCVNLLDGLLPNDYDIVVEGVTNDMLSEAILKLELKDAKRFNASQKHTITKIEFHDGNVIEMSAIKKDTLKEDFLTRDFNINALYMKFSDKKTFEVISFDNALEKRNELVLSTISNPKDAFEKEPRLLFRLINILIKYPKYKMDKDLNLYITNSCKNWINIINSDFNRGKKDARRDRFTAGIRKLFEQRHLDGIDQALMKLDAFKTITCCDEPGNAPDSLNDLKPKHRLLYWVLNYSLKSNSKPCIPFKDLIGWEKFEQNCIKTYKHMTSKQDSKIDIVQLIKDEDMKQDSKIQEKKTLSM